VICGSIVFVREVLLIHYWGQKTLYFLVRTSVKLPRQWSRIAPVWLLYEVRLGLFSPMMRCFMTAQVRLLH